MPTSSIVNDCSPAGSIEDAHTVVELSEIDIPISTRCDCLRCQRRSDRSVTR